MLCRNGSKPRSFFRRTAVEPRRRGARNALSTTTSEARTTTDHTTIRKWVEARDGKPARVKTGGEGGILRIDFGEKEPHLEAISWEQFFEVFDENELAFLYQDKTSSGDTSRFNKFVNRSEG